MKVKTMRFGELDVGEEEIINFPEGILGFPDLKKYCLIDAGDETLILWLQSLEDANIAFPVIEPKIFKPDYVVKLSAQELAQLRLTSINSSGVFNILTIPKEVDAMTANMKAPLVINLKEQVGKQVILQENEYTIKHPMFRELRAHLTTIHSTRNTQQAAQDAREHVSGPINLKSMIPSAQIKVL